MRLTSGRKKAYSDKRVLDDMVRKLDVDEADAGGYDGDSVKVDKSRELQGGSVVNDE